MEILSVNLYIYNYAYKSPRRFDGPAIEYILPCILHFSQLLLHDYFVCVGVRYSVNMMFVMLLLVCIHTGQAEKLAWPRWESNPRPLGHTSPMMLCQLSYAVKSVRVDDISELSLVPSISVYSMILTT